LNPRAITGETLAEFEYGIGRPRTLGLVRVQGEDCICFKSGFMIEDKPGGYGWQYFVSGPGRRKLNLVTFRGDELLDLVENSRIEKCYFVSHGEFMYWDADGKVMKYDGTRFRIVTRFSLKGFDFKSFSTSRARATTFNGGVLTMVNEEGRFQVIDVVKV
jgi:hypothetical protein